MRGYKNIIVLPLIFFLVFFVHANSPNITSADSRWLIPTAVSILQEGNANLDEFQQYIDWHRDYSIKVINNQLYSEFPIGTPLLTAGFLLLLEKQPLFSVPTDLIVQSIIAEDWIRTKLTLYLEVTIASVVVALSAIFIYLIGQQLTKPKNVFTPLLAVLIFAFCTPAWSTASRALWQHGPSLLMLSIALYLLLLAHRKPAVVQFVSIPLALAYIIRPTNFLSVIFLTVFVFIHYRKYLLRYLGWGLALAVLFVSFNVAAYNSLLSPYYTLGYYQVASLPFLLEGTVGTLISPNRGLFVFSPIMLLAFAGILLKVRRENLMRLDWFLGAIIIGHWLIISLLDDDWWGGWAFGPRYFTDMIPYFIYFLIPVLPTGIRPKDFRQAGFNLLLLLAIIVSFAINFRGATDPATWQWNYEPTNIDQAPQRLWDWQDLQFLRGLKQKIYP